MTKSEQQATKKRNIETDYAGDEASNEDDQKCIPPTMLKKTPLKKTLFTEDVLTQGANYGGLEILEGTWVNYVDKTNTTIYGIHTTCMPSPGSTPETFPGKFRFVCENYTEEMKFTLIENGVRNRGGTNEQMIGAVKYEQSITNHPEGKGIHEENGMYLYLGDIYHHPASCESVEKDIGLPELKAGDDGPPFVPFHKISRSGTIPHGNNILLLGEISYECGKPKFKTGIDAWEEEHLAISKSMGSAGVTIPETRINLDLKAPDWVHDKSLPKNDPTGSRTYTQRILAHELYPYSVRPDMRLRHAIENQEIKGYHFIKLDTEYDNGQGPQGGIHNTPFVERNTPVKKMTLRMWIEDVIEDGQTIQQLQYEQVMFFVFSFGSNGGTTFWPHIQVNTLRKKPDTDK